MIGDFMKSESFLANVGHVLAGALVAVTAVLFTHNPVLLTLVGALFLVYVGLKEFWFDLKYESGETLGSSAIDAVGYLGGYGAGMLLVALARVCGSW